MSQHTFHSLGIRREITEVLAAEGVVEPTPIQAQAIPLLLKGEDLIAQAQTGTGKTLAFVLPILERIRVQSKDVQALIITPTRELALQITGEVKKLAAAIGANVLAAYGGQDVERQIHKLKGNIHIVIGTPGRLLDHLRRETVHFGNISALVLDEADQMLHMGFLQEVEQIMNVCSSRRQTMLFSATMPQAVRNLAGRFMRNPQEVSIQSKKVTLDEIKQIAVETTDRGKQDALCMMLDEHQPFLAIIFCRTKRRASTLCEALIERGYDADELHGDLSQLKREQVMKRFREAKLHLLVATDIAARGLDIEGISHVYNYDIPHDVESYIHRIGRTGRAGESGIAVTFVSARDRDELAMIEKGIQMRLEKRNASGDVIKTGRKRQTAGQQTDDRRGDRSGAQRGGDKRRGAAGASRSGGAGFERRGAAGASRSGGDGFERRGAAGASRSGGAGFERRGAAGASRSGGAGFERRGAAGASRGGGAGFERRGAAGASRGGGDGFERRGAAGASRGGGAGSERAAGASRSGGAGFERRGATGASRGGGDRRGAGAPTRDGRSGGRSGGYGGSRGGAGGKRPRGR